MVKELLSTTCLSRHSFLSARHVTAKRRGCLALIPYAVRRNRRAGTVASSSPPARRHSGRGKSTAYGELTEGGIMVAMAARTRRLR